MPQEEKAYTVKREWGENPLRYQSPYADYGFASSVKAGHWETEKAGAEQKQRLKSVSRKTCFDVAL